MRLLKSIDDCIQWRKAQKKTLGFIPTMGALHEGHLSLVKKAKDSGDYLLDHLMALQNDYPDLVSNSRGKGLFCAFDLPDSGARDELATVLMDNKVIVLGSGDRSIRFRPHLNIKTEEIDTGISAIRKTLNKIKIDN